MSGSPAASVARWEDFRDRQRSDIADAIVTAVVSGADPIPTVTQIAEAVGISRKTFYKYFDSIDDAILYAEQRILYQLAPDWQAIAAGAANGREHFLALLQQVALNSFARPDVMRFISFFDYSFRRRGLTAQQHANYQASVRDMFTDGMLAFRRGQQEGSIRGDVEPRVVIRALGHALSGMVQRLLAIEPGITAADSEVLVRLEIDVWRRYLSSTD